MSEQDFSASGFTPSDQRYFPRWEVRNRISYFRENTTKPQEGFTKDLSCSGACISIPDELSPSERVKCTIHLSNEETITVMGRIRWAKEDGMQQLAGIDFYDIDEKTQDLILQHAFEVNKEQVVKNWFKGWGDSKTK